MGPRMHEARTKTSTVQLARMLFTRFKAALGVAFLVAGCVSPYDAPYRSPTYSARPYPPTYQQQPVITPYPSEPATMRLRDAYQPPAGPLPSVEIGPSLEQPPPKITQQEPEVLIPEPNNGPPPGSRTILHPFPDMRAP
jgi:hypothetical protein